MSEATKQHQKISEPPPCLTVGTMFLFFLGLVCVNIRIMCFNKKLYFSLICPQDILPKGMPANSNLAFLWFLCQQRGPPTIVSRFIQMATQLYPVPAGQLEFVWKLIKVLYPPFERSFVVTFHQFCPRPERLAVVPWAVNFFTMLCTVDTGTLKYLKIDL